MSDYIMDGSGIKRLRLLNDMGEPDVIECDGNEYVKERTCHAVRYENGTLKYRKKPVVIQAFRYMVDSSTPDWFMDRVSSKTIIPHDDGTCEINTLEGTMTADKGDFIILGVDGEVYPCKPDIFAKTYECVEQVVEHG